MVPVYRNERAILILGKYMQYFLGNCPDCIQNINTYKTKIIRPRHSTYDFIEDPWALLVLQQYISIMSYLKFDVNLDINSRVFKPISSDSEEARMRNLFGGKISVQSGLDWSKTGLSLDLEFD